MIEQITYLLFIRRLDDIHTLAERKANRLRCPIEDPVCTPGQDTLDDVRAHAAPDVTVA